MMTTHKVIAYLGSCAVERVEGREPSSKDRYIFRCKKCKETATLTDFDLAADHREPALSFHDFAAKHQHPQ